MEASEMLEMLCPDTIAHIIRDLEDGQDFHTVRAALDIVRDYVRMTEGDFQDMVREAQKRVPALH